MYTTKMYCIFLKDLTRKAPVRSVYMVPRLHISAGILRIPAFSVPVAFFSQESRFLFRRNFFRTVTTSLDKIVVCKLVST